MDKSNVLLCIFLAILSTASPKPVKGDENSFMRLFSDMSRHRPKELTKPSRHASRTSDLIGKLKVEVLQHELKQEIARWLEEDPIARGTSTTTTTTPESTTSPTSTTTTTAATTTQNSDPNVPPGFWKIFWLLWRARNNLL